MNTPLATTSTTRRNVIRGAVWSVPTITIATQAPAFAASIDPTCGCAGLDLEGSHLGPFAAVPVLTPASVPSVPSAGDIIGVTPANPSFTVTNSGTTTYSALINNLRPGWNLEAVHVTWTQKTTYTATRFVGSTPLTWAAPVTVYDWSAEYRFHSYGLTVENVSTEAVDNVIVNLIVPFTGDLNVFGNATKTAFANTSASKWSAPVASPVVGVDLMGVTGLNAGLQYQFTHLSTIGAGATETLDFYLYATQGSTNAAGLPSINELVPPFVNSVGNTAVGTATGTTVDSNVNVSDPLEIISVLPV